MRMSKRYVSEFVSGWLSDTTAGGATSFFNGVDLVSYNCSTVLDFDTLDTFRSDSGLPRALLASGMDSSLMAQGYLIFTPNSHFNHYIADIRTMRRFTGAVQ